MRSPSFSIPIVSLPAVASAATAVGVIIIIEEVRP
jgi:hypothetical protein